jgi:hypothetical protein
MTKSFTMKKLFLMIAGMALLACSSRQALYNYHYGQAVKNEKTPEGCFRSKESLWNRIKPAMTGEMRKAYEQAFPQSNRPEGTVTFKFLLDAKGNVFDDTLVQSDFSDTAFINAVRNILVGIQFNDISKEHEDDITKAVWLFRFKK